MNRCLSGPVFLLLTTASITLAQPLVTFDTYRDDRLYRFELTGQGNLPQPRSLGEVGLENVRALAEGPDGTLWVAVVETVVDAELWRIDRETLTPELIGPFGVDLLPPVDLASDGEGGLWLAADDVLHAIDADTGKATPLGGDTDLGAIAFYGPTLYGVVGNFQEGWFLVTIDPTTGAQTPETLLDLDDILDDFLLFYPAAMDFDAFGGLWVNVLHGTFAPLPGFFNFSIYYFADPFSGVHGARSSYEFGQDWRPLMVTGTTSPVVDVPALDAGGLIVFALMLAGAALIRCGSHARRAAGISYR